MERRRTIIGIFNAIGGLSGLLSIAMFFWQGGKLAEKFSSLAEACAVLNTQVALLNTQVASHSAQITKLDTTVEAEETRLGKVESSGSPGLQKHEALDDQRVSDIRQRMNRMEDESIAIRNTLTDIRGDLREIKAHLGIANGNGKKL